MFHNGVGRIDKGSRLFGSVVQLVELSLYFYIIRRQARKTKGETDTVMVASKVIKELVYNAKIYGFNGSGE